MRVDLPLKMGKVPQRTELGAEEQGAPVGAVVKRLLADAIVHQRQAALVPVPQGEREHADESRHGLAQAPDLDRGEHDFGIGLAAKAVAERGELPAQFAKVVNFAVEHDHVSRACGVHWLAAGLAQIDDREPPVSEPDARACIEPRPARDVPAHRAFHARRPGDLPRAGGIDEPVMAHM